MSEIDQCKLLNLQPYKRPVDSLVTWGQYRNEFILMSEDRYALVQMRPTGRWLAVTGEKMCGIKSGLILKLWSHGSLFKSVEEAKEWAEKQLFPDWVEEE